MASGVRKGPWTEKEDEKLRSYITKYGQGHWEALAHRSGLNRTGQSCRLRWLNYLRPGVRHGNITLQEQLIILQLHFRWGNRWAKIAECLPGRSDNEVKNYWRTRVQKQAKKLQCDVKEIMHQVWIPQLAELIRAQIKSSSSTHDLNVMRIRPVSDPVSHQSPDTCDGSNENVSGDTLAAWIGAGSDGDHADQTYLGRYVPDEDYVLWMKQGVEVDEEQELATAWDDPGSCYLGNLLNDEDMVFLRQQLLDDHQA